MTDNLTFLQQRRSAARLTEPAPTTAELQTLFALAARAPDHANLKPARFLVIRGAAREELGEVFLSALTEAGESVDPERTRGLPMRAPMLIAVICSPTEHPKVPECEQQWSVACAAFALLLGLEGMGYAGMWRTGKPTYLPAVKQALQLAPQESLLGFLYVGTREGEIRPPQPAPALSEWVADWPGLKALSEAD